MDSNKSENSEIQQLPNIAIKSDNSQLAGISHKLKIQQLPSKSDESNLQLFSSKSNVNSVEHSSVPFISGHFNFDGEVEISKKKNITNKRVWDKTGHCLLCEDNVTNFT